MRGCRGGERCATVGTELKSEERRRSSGGALEKQRRNDEEISGEIKEKRWRGSVDGESLWGVRAGEGV